MKVLPLDFSDPLLKAEIARIHQESGFDYRLPDLATPLFPVKRYVANDANYPLAAAALKVSAEAYLWMNHDLGTPEDRITALVLLNADMASRARELGFDQVYCVLPPEISARFGHRLTELGWKPARNWPLYTFQLR